MTHHHIQDHRGRIGDIIEDRGHEVLVQPHGACYLANDYNSTAGVPGVRRSMTSWWTRQPDGTLRGLWADSQLHGFYEAFFID